MEPEYLDVMLGRTQNSVLMNPKFRIVQSTGLMTQSNTTYAVSITKVVLFPGIFKLILINEYYAVSFKKDWSTSGKKTPFHCLTDHRNQSHIRWKSHACNLKYCYYERQRVLTARSVTVYVVLSWLSFIHY